MKTKNTVNYPLHIQYYKYNTGAGDNGTFTGVMIYNTLEEAEKSWANLEELIKEGGSGDILDDWFAVDGYIEELLAIFKVEITKTYDDHGLLELKTIETRVKS